MFPTPITAILSMTKFFHGTDQDLAELQENSYVTKSFKDACKFGYRKAVLNNSAFVYIYTIECSDMAQDINRDRAFILTKNCPVTKFRQFDTYKTPYKLKKFKLG
jgi:hypothetical protein